MLSKCPLWLGRKSSAKEDSEHQTTFSSSCFLVDPTDDVKRGTALIQCDKSRSIDLWDPSVWSHVGLQIPAWSSSSKIAEYCKARSRGYPVLLPGEDKKKVGERKQSAQLFPWLLCCLLMAAILGIWAMFCSHFEIPEMFQFRLSWGRLKGKKKREKKS